MTVGLSGTYAINSVNFNLLPTTGRWIARDNQGFDGEGHPIYSSRRQYELVWDLIDPVSWSQILSAYNIVQNTGTVSFDLPQFDAADDRFKTYSGTTIAEPEMDNPFFMGYRENVRLIIYNIQT